MARLFRSVHGNWNKKTKKSLSKKPTLGKETDGKIDNISLSINRPRVVLLREPPIITLSFHMENPVFTDTPETVFTTSSMNIFVANNVKNPPANVTTDFSSILYSLLASTSEYTILPECTDFTMETSTRVDIGVTAADPMKAGSMHVTHFARIESIIMNDVCLEVYIYLI